MAELLIKLVERLHNLRTLGAQPPHRQARIVQQSMDLLVPFCDRLGLYRLKRDLAFRPYSPPSTKRRYRPCSPARPSGSVTSPA